MAPSTIVDVLVFLGIDTFWSKLKVSRQGTDYAQMLLRRAPRDVESRLWPSRQYPSLLFVEADSYITGNFLYLLAPYDVVTVVSQWSLNNVLKRAFEATPELHTANFKPPVDEDDDEPDDFSGCDMTFDAPKIQLQLSTENKITVLLLNVKSTHLKYFKITGRQVSDLEVDIPPFTIALDVNLSIQDAPFTSLPESLQARFSSNKDVQVKKTLIDLKGASLARLRKSLSTLYSVVSDINQTALMNGYIERYLKVLAEHQDSFTFNYFATSPSSTVAATIYPLPSIVPTGVTALQNLPPGNSTDHEKTGDESLLAYLQMTDDGTLPRAPLPTVDPQWATGIDTRVMYPIIAFSKSKFLEKSIIPKLAEINRRATWIIDRAWIEATLVPPEVKYELLGHLGWTQATDSDVAWKAVNFDDVPTDARVKVSGPGAWYRFKNTGYRNGVSKVVYEACQQTTTENFIFVPTGTFASGKVRIEIFGRTLVEFHTKFSLSSSSGSVMNEWATSIEFDSSKPEEHIKVTTDDIVRAKTTARCHDEELERKAIRPAKGQLERFEFSLKDLGAHLKRSLEEDWPFFVPVKKGPLYIDRVFFGKGLDLICETKPHEI